MIDHFVCLPSTRRHEIEADYIGMLLMASAGYDPRVGIKKKRIQLLSKPEVMEEFNISPDVVTYGILAKGYCRNGNVEDAENIICRMSKKGLIANTILYNTLISGYCKEGYVEKAVEICSRMMEQGLQPDIITYCTLIHGYCEMGQLEAAKGLYYEMTIKGYKPDVVAYTALIDGHFKNGYSDAALNLYKEKMGAGIASNFFTVGCLIDGLCKDGRINDAIKFFLEHSMGCRPSHITYSILIGALCRNGRVFQASKFFRDMRRNGLWPEVSDYAAVTKGHFGARHVFAVMMQADMLKMGTLPNAYIHKVLNRGYQGMAYFASAEKCHEAYGI
ncbi:hypothetical protein OROGR_008577 [Orobanche gracilis]